MPNEKGEKKAGRDENGRFVKGEWQGGPGRPPGKKNFETEWREFISKVAEDNGMTPQQINEQLYAVGWKKAKEGDYQFWRDIHDRLFGRAQQSIDHTTDGKELPTPILNVIDKYEDKN